MSDPNLFEKASQEWDAGNLRNAFELFYKAAEQGDTSSKVCLGFFYFVGEGIIKDTEKALYWYKKAAMDGDISAFLNIAHIYREAGNFRGAKYWLNKALKQKDGEAAFELAKIYLIKKRKDNLDKARKYLRFTLESEMVTEDSQEEARKLLKVLSGK